MPAGLALGYLVFDVKRPERWHGFCRDMLGLPEPSSNGDGSLGYRIDDRRQRLIVRPGKADDLAALGLACNSDAVLDAMALRLQQAGLTVETDDAALCAARRVMRLVRTFDPMGNAVELHVATEAANTSFASNEVPGGFRTGDHGMGHAVLVARDLAAMERFYIQVLGFGVTERLATKVGPINLRGTFLHCNRRHHSLALFELPLRQRLHHFMLQANDFADVGRAFERARKHKVPLSLGLGQHPDPDATFSFYGQTPSGFDFEIGAGSREIEPAGWQTMKTDVTSTWGHKPKLRLQIKMAKELAIRSLGG